MEAGIIFLVTTKTLVDLVACGIFALVWMYINKKPLGMQTLLDQFVKDFICIAILRDIGSFLVFTKFTDNYSHQVASAMIIFYHFTAFAFINQVILTLVIRYLSVFHQTKLNEINDKTVILVTRVLNASWAVIAHFIDDYLSGGPIYYFLTGVDTGRVSSNFLSKIMFISVIVVAIIVQVRIEHYKKKIQPQNVEGVQHDQYSFRIAVVIASIVSTMFVWLLGFGWSIHGSDSGTAIAKNLVVSIVGFSLLTIVLPCMVIKRNQNMYKFCVDKIQTIAKLVIILEESGESQDDSKSEHVDDESQVEQGMSSNSISGNELICTVILIFVTDSTDSTSKYHPCVEIGPQLAFEVEEHVLLNGTIMIFLGDPQFKTFPRRWFRQKSMKEAIGGNGAANLGHLSGFPKLTIVSERK